MALILAWSTQFGFGPCLEYWLWYSYVITSILEYLIGYLMGFCDVTYSTSFLSLRLLCFFLSSQEIPLARYHTDVYTNDPNTQTYIYQRGRHRFLINVWLLTISAVVCQTEPSTSKEAHFFLFLPITYVIICLFRFPCFGSLDFEAWCMQKLVNFLTFS